MPTRLLILGLDGATLDLIEPWKDSLPNLAKLMSEGACGRLRSTVPPATFPAWTSMMTGVNPGQHGIFDFARRVPGTYRIEFINATYRQCPSVWRLLSDAGLRVGIMGLPATYPPEPVNGFLISGFDSPVATGIDRSFVYPPRLYDEIRRAVGTYEITDFQELHIGRGWHRAALEKLSHAARRRTKIAAYLLDRDAWDCFFVHFGESDTVAHHFWAFHDPHSPRYDQAQAAELGHAIRTIYQALDRAVGELLVRAGEDATIMLVSDHGSGGTGEYVIHLNRWLAQQGWLCFEPPGVADRVGGRLKRVGFALPVPLQEWTFRGPLSRFVGRLETSARLGNIDWTRSHAFSEEVNTFPGIWLNVRDREPRGIVEPGAERERLVGRIVARLLDWRNPHTGEPIIAHAWPREELYHGPAVESSPDIVLEPALDRGYAYTFLSSDGRPGLPVRKLAPSERLGAKGGSMNGSHRSDGVCILAGASVLPGAGLDGARIVDITPTLLRLLGVPLPGYFDGRVLAAVRGCGEQAQVDPTVVAAAAPPEPYTEVESAAVRHRLQGLGYQG